ncbi:hypothetical protein EG68_05720 [Paragonimus skrjabini miyazakii]|uniref:Uncharacterized protein n=1 Tax=Paragonimus skrjabini miyazakii TaxID=59628 RepID=A0A8S9YV06_9TREM|nr:hypothetical protein EG68_05720 [Paragonimus skrjabini miyazakii]
MQLWILLLLIPFSSIQSSAAELNEAQCRRSVLQLQAHCLENAMKQLNCFVKNKEIENLLKQKPEVATNDKLKNYCHDCSKCLPLYVSCMLEKLSNRSYKGCNYAIDQQAELRKITRKDTKQRNHSNRIMCENFLICMNLILYILSTISCTLFRSTLLSIR